MRLFLIFALTLASTGAQTADPTRVAVICYHDFSPSEPETEMRISTGKFRRQMQALKDLNLEVISMPDFQAWKRGGKTIPEQSVVITIDDGWKSVYTDAFPILKEFGFPFTLFLYKSYVDGGGKALTTAMIREMQRHGATIGSHSVDHPYPSAVKQHRKAGPDAYDKFLREQFGESKRFLEATFGEPVTTFAYPGGFHTQEMFPLAAEYNYQHLFTVLPDKIRHDSDDLTLPRYVILGTHDPIFDLAVRFAAHAGNSLAPLAEFPGLPFPVRPEPGSMVSTRQPEILADLSNADLNPDTLVMQIAGLGKVPARWDPETEHFSWTVNRPLRLPTCQVQITWKDASGKSPEQPLRWTFKIDREAAYVPRD